MERGILAEVEEGLWNGEILIDFNGHYGQNTGPVHFTSLPEWNLWLWKAWGDKIAFQDILRRSEAVFNNTVVERYPFRFDLYKGCTECGRDIQFCFDGNILRIENPCEYPGGVDTFSVSIGVPSGRLVFGNDFRSLFGKSLFEYDTHYTSEIKRCTEEYALEGLVYLYAGGSDPLILREMEGTSILIRVSSTSNRIETDLGFSPVGQIHTSIQWLSVMDYDDFLKRGGEPLGEEHLVAPIGSGRWEFTSLYHKNKGEVTEDEWVSVGNLCEDAI